MSDEASIHSSLRVDKGNLEYFNQPQGFSADVATANGPTPGCINVLTTGTDIDLDALGTPGLGRLMNIDATNYIDIGIYDPEIYTFYPLMRLLPGESYVLRLSPDIEAEYGTGSGTGTSGASTNTLRAKAHTASCKLLAEFFDA